MISFNECEKLLEDGHYKAAVIEAGALLEKAIAQAYKDILLKLDLKTRELVLSSEKEVGEGKRFSDFGLGQMLGVFSKCDLFTKINQEKKMDFRALNKSNLDSLNRLRIDCFHKGYNPTKIEAEFVVVTSKLIVTELGYLEAPIISSLQLDEKMERNTTIEFKKDISLNNLPRPEYQEFVGRETYIEEIMKYLKGRPYVISIDGIGGVGKSALALEIARRCWDNGLFQAIVWMSAKRTRLRIVGIEDIIPSLTNYETLISHILLVLGMSEYDSAPLDKKQQIILDCLSKIPILLIVDNLETIDDARIISFLKDLPSPSKALITSRRRLGEVERIVQLKEFNRDESFQLLLLEAKSKSLTIPDQKKVFTSFHEVTGGIPLALKIAIGWLAQGLSPDNIIKKMKTGEGHLLKFCFDESWMHFLDETSKQIFSIFPVFDAEKVTFDQIVAASGLPQEKTKDALSKLAHLSLINLQEGESDEGIVQTFYSMLPLTLSYAQEKLESDRGKEKDARKRLARYFEQHLKTQDALQQYGAALEDLGGQTESGRTAALLANLALATYQRGNYKRAKELFEQAIGTDPRLSYAYQMWATVERQQGNYGRAEELFKTATHLNPNNAIIWSSWGMMKRDEGDLASAEQFLEKALALRNNSDPIIAQQLSVIRTLKGKYAESLKTATNVIKKEPSTPEDKAINRALYISQSETFFRWGALEERKGQMLDAKEKFTKSIEEIEKAISLGRPDKYVQIQHKKVLKALGFLLIKLEDYKAAELPLAQSLWDPPTTELDLQHNHEVDLLRATVLHKQNKKSQLIDLCRMAIARYKDPKFLKFIPGQKITL